MLLSLHQLPVIAIAGWRNIVIGWVAVAAVISIAGRGGGVVVAAVDGGHSTVDKPVSDGWLAWAW